MVITASRLRENIYRLLDHVIETGEAIEIERNGHRLRIVVDDAPSKLGRLVERDTVVGDPEELVHLDWSDQWQP